MRTIPTLLVALATGTLATAQQRYLEPVFDDVTVSDSVMYQMNISVQPAVESGGNMPPAPTPDFMQVYAPAGDTATDRPVVILHSTGSYFRPFVGGGIYGNINDSILVATATNLAKHGFVAIPATYRKGWNPISDSTDLRTGSLLIASYRGIQDVRSLVRYLRGTVADDDNPYGIDPDRIAMMGYGTGGYNAYNNNFLDEAEEVNALPKFIDTQGNPFLIPQAYGDPDGLMAAQLNSPQNPGFDSRVQFTVGIGGAMGDTSWIDGNEDESPTIGLHSIRDQNAPFGVGDVFVPVGDRRLFVINVAGPRATIATANRLGVNDELEAVNAVLREVGDFLTLRSQALEDEAFTTRDQFSTTLSVENLYPFVTEGDLPLANQYNYIDSATLSVFVQGFNQATGDTTTTATYLSRERRSNPNVTNPQAALQVLDTILAYTLPRAYVALELGTAEDIRTFVSVDDVQPAEVGFSLFPNPLFDRAQIRVNPDIELQLLAIYDNAGRRVAATRLSGSEYTIDRGNLPAGHYTLFVQTSEGALATQLIAR